MSEEEQEAIWYLAACVNGNIPLPEEALSWVKVALDYTDKLEQENEELKELTKKQMLFTFKNNILDSIELIKNDFISKDRIKNKIKEAKEELEKEMKEVKDFTDFNPMIPVLMTEIDTLKDLLKEE